MVRLKHKNFSIQGVCFIESQFHYGSIKTKLKEFIWTDTAGSQFHYGSIKTEPRWN